PSRDDSAGRSPAASTRIGRAGGGPSAFCDTRRRYWYFSVEKKVVMFDFIAVTSLSLITMLVKRASRMRTGAGWLRSPPPPRWMAVPALSLALGGECVSTLVPFRSVITAFGVG